MYQANPLFVATQTQPYNPIKLKENTMNIRTPFQRLSHFVLLTFIALFMTVAASSAGAGVSVGTPGDTVVMHDMIEVSFDMQDLLEAEQSLLESLAGGSQFEVLGGWEVGSGPGQRSAEIVVDDVDVTSLDGNSFILYVLDEEGEQVGLDVIVQEDGVLSVYDPATDSEAYFSPVVTELEAATSVTPNWGARKPRPSRYAADSAKKKKKKKKKPGPRGPKGGPKTDPKDDPKDDPTGSEKGEGCRSDADCGEGQVCLFAEDPEGGICFTPVQKGELDSTPKDDPKGDPKPEPEPDPEPEIEIEEDTCDDCPEGTVCIESEMGAMCYEPIFKDSML